MLENTLAYLELEASNSFSGYSDENVVDIWIRTEDCRKFVVGRGRCDVIYDSKWLSNELLIAKYARKQGNVPRIGGFNSFSGYSDETVVDIWIRTVDCRKFVVGRGRRDVISDSK